jgi:hypothetical protein
VKIEPDLLDDLAADQEGEDTTGEESLEDEFELDVGQIYEATLSAVGQRLAGSSMDIAV